MIDLMVRIIEREYKIMTKNNDRMRGLQMTVIIFSLNISYAFILYDLFKNDINEVPPYLMVISLLVLATFMYDLVWLFIRNNADTIIDEGNFLRLSFESDREYFNRKYEKVKSVLSAVDKVILVHKLTVYPLYLLNITLTIYGVMT